LIMPRQKLVCLLPARNCSEELPHYFESVSRFADAVVALDDGSPDSTREILAANPLVEILLANPPRQSYDGWDDAANRNRLLAAAAELEPHWIMSLDADELIDPDDGAALREFLDREAQPGFGYFFRVFRMIGDERSYDQSNLFVGRLFAFEPGQRFPQTRLHLVPLPTSIPRRRWVRTTIRIQHKSSLTANRRHARFQKYVEADRDRVFQTDYGHLLAPPGKLKPWRRRAPYLPVVANSAWHRETEDATEQNPLLSAVIISRDDEALIERAVRSVVDQDCPVPFEVIVVTSGTDQTAEIVRREFPQVRVVELARPALPGQARNAGLKVARGRYVSFPGSHVELPVGSLAARIRAHLLGYAMVTGTALNGTRTWAGWAAYFLDHSKCLAGRPSEVLPKAPSHCSYLREALLEIGGFPEGLRADEDTVVNRTLFRRGYGAYRAQDVVFIHHSPCRTPLQLLRHRFTRGRSHGRITIMSRPPTTARFLDRRLLYFVLLSVPARLRRTTIKVHRWGRGLRARYWLAFPLVVAGAIAHWLGACIEIIRLSRHSAAAEDARLAVAEVLQDA
jgi:glycosyltransferase involved in cell wall biosynthesis